MPDVTLTSLSNAVQQVAYPLNGIAQDYDPLMNLIGNARFVLLGEATHGTHEFYAQRAEITKRLIQEKGFTAVAIEADFPDAYRVNRFVRGMSQDFTPEEALRSFERFPTWMWRNTDVLEFIGWLHQHNDALSDTQKVGFYGLDLYSLYDSIHEVLTYLERIDPAAAQQARSRYSCFEDFEEDSQAYGYVASFNIEESCQEQAINQLLELQKQSVEYAEKEDCVAEDELFYLEQNARLVKNAEEYYRSMFHGRANSWNLRDRHMAETLDQLANYLSRRETQSKIVIWEHNSHLGDARATEMTKSGEWNVGQLVRESYGQDAFLIGFTTYTGTVIAADNWGETPQLKHICPALPDSYEALFHETGLPQFWLNLRSSNPAIDQLRKERLERAIGVIYRPDSERVSHYFKASLPEQFDAVIHIDNTRALQPLDRLPHPMRETPDTFPSAL